MTTFWIDVEDHLPGPDQVVLLAIADKIEPVWMGFRDDTDDCWRLVDACPVEHVTHWADLPQPPKA